MMSVHCCIVSESKSTKAFQPGDILMSVGNFTLLGALPLPSASHKQNTKTHLSTSHTFQHIHLFDDRQ